MAQATERLSDRTLGRDIPVDAALAALGRYTQPLLLDASVRPAARGRGQA